MAYDERPCRLVGLRNGTQRHLAAARTADVDITQFPRILLEIRLYLQNDAVLVQLGKHGRNLPLAEGIV